MTELERRALLGDRQAQEECTRKGIVLACPFCGGDFDAEFNGVMFKMERTNLYAHKRTGRCVLDGEIIFDLSDWNTRPAPPVGRCGECEKSPDIGTKTKSMRWCRRFRAEVKPDGYCDEFRQKGSEENADD